MTPTSANRTAPGNSPWNDPRANPFVSLRGVTKKFGAATAVDHVDLDIFEKEFFALLGPSGCGKTTILRMLAGFETPTEGRILLDGEDVSTIPPHKRPVNMMFQSYALFPHLSVEQNITFGLKQDKLPAPQIRDRVREMLDLVQLQNLARRKPHQLSGGQRQRVALARSLAKRPKILLLDEPLGALDRKLREATQFELMNIQEETGVTFVIVTHDQEEAMTVSSRIAVMDQGKFVQIAEPTEIYESPATRYVAGFIGDVNVIPGRLTSTSTDRIEVESGLTGGVLHVLPTPGRPDHSVGDDIFVALRPEKVRISRDAPADPKVNTVSGTVWDIGYFGDFSMYHVCLEDGTMIKASQPNLVRAIHRDISWEDQVWLTWPEDAGVILAA